MSGLAHAIAKPLPTHPTPDVRVINASPRSMLPERTDLPTDGKFYLTYESPTRNSEMISGWGVAEGRDYLAASGRIDGWSIEYTRGTRTAKVPEWIYYNGIIYQTEAGHAATDEQLGRCNVDDGWVEIPAPEGMVYLCEWRRTQPNGLDYLRYQVKLKHRNVAVQIRVGGYEGDFELEWLLDQAADQIAVLELIPLSETVTYAP